MRIRIVRNDDEIDNILYKRDLWTRDIDYIISANIYEYDIKSANLNLAIYYDLLDKETTKYLETLPKNVRNIEVGNLMRDDKFLNKELSKSFARMRKEFFKANDIKEHQVLSIKKDAVFLVNKPCENTKFRNVEFVLANKYTSFHKINGIEFYYRNKGKVLDIKGIKDEVLPLHKDYMCKFLIDIFNLLETSSNERIVSKLKTFIKLYKSKKLEYGYYREFNPDSYFSLIMDEGNVFKSENYLTGFDIDISYNYIWFILPLVQRFFTLKV
mgnify:FL=1